MTRHLTSSLSIVRCLWRSLLYVLSSFFRFAAYSPSDQLQRSSTRKSYLIPATFMFPPLPKQEKALVPLHQSLCFSICAKKRDCYFSNCAWAPAAAAHSSDSVKLDFCVTTHRILSRSYL
ncbi:unnamed protein product [Amoebophrya sp. A120]|nr:unnamed protein product [Amoebophrya sp. A120]|eukprot:GSA120T00012566001.1